MANKTAKKQSTGGDTEARVIALAEQLGWFLGTARAKADGWLESEKVKKELARIRDGASELLQHIEGAARSASIETRGKKPAKAGPVVAGPAARKAAAKPKPSTVVAPKPSRGAVDAPGKKHRKPPPQERLDKRMGEPVGKQMGQKNFKMGTGKRRISG